MGMEALKDIESTPARYALIYGLSANPIHQGHVDLLIGTLVNLQNLEYDVAQTLIIPVYRRNPTGNRKDVLPETFELRVKMCELAAQEVLAVLPHTPISVSRVEAHLAIKNDTPNYTADTLIHLKTHVLSTFKLIFVISSEIVSGENPEFSHWYQTETILKTAMLAVCPRPGFPLNQGYINSLSTQEGCFILLDGVETPDISSTTLRHRLEGGENPLTLAQEGLMPFSIAHYLNTHNLYQNSAIALNKAPFHHETSE